jgi:NADPH-dependent 2,4-dienoyl-CoA reductase/sulfur reductase-like enzyme
LVVPEIQGRVAGENTVGGKREFLGSVGTQVVKVFDLAIARTGLREGEARRAGFDPYTTHLKAWDHKAYYPGAHDLQRRTGIGNPPKKLTIRDSTCY